MGPSDIKMAKNMMDGPVFGRFATVFGTVRQQIAQKTVGRCVCVMRWTVWMECQAGQKVRGLFMEHQTSAYLGFAEMAHPVKMFGYALFLFQCQLIYGLSSVPVARQRVQFRAKIDI